MSKILREFIRYVINEAAITATDAAKEDLCLHIARNYGAQGPVSMILWDANALVRVSDEYLKLSIDAKIDDLIAVLEDDPSKWIIGYIEITNNPQEKGGEAWGSWEVVASAARKGYGPFLYDLAMSYVGALIPDRHIVSTKAQAIWNYYRKRSDITTKPLDNVKNPKTPPKEDDAYVYNTPEKLGLNYAYSTESPINVAQFTNNSPKKVMQAAKEIQQFLGKNSVPVDLIARSLFESIRNAGVDFFYYKYKGVD